MAQGDFTKEEARQTKQAVDEIFTALPKSRKLDFVGHLNDVFLFLEAAERNAPEVAAKSKPKGGKK